jgi:hypothetical protein
MTGPSWLVATGLPGGAGIVPPMNHPADPGAVAAKARVDALLDRLTRVDLQVVVVPPPDSERLEAQDRARTAAAAAGRRELLASSRAAARELTLRAFARAGFSGTWAVTDMAVSVARPEDRVAAAIAFEEAAMAAVVEDLVDEETLETLRSTSDDLVSLTGLPSPGSLSAIGAPTELEGRGLLVVTLVAILVIGLAALAFVAGGRSALVALALAIAMVAGLWRRRRRRRTDP